MKGAGSGAGEREGADWATEEAARFDLVCRTIDCADLRARIAAALRAACARAIGDAERAAEFEFAVRWKANWNGAGLTHEGFAAKVTGAIRALIPTGRAASPNTSPAEEQPR